MAPVLSAVENRSCAQSNDDVIFFVKLSSYIKHEVQYQIQKVS